MFDQEVCLVEKVENFFWGNIAQQVTVNFDYVQKQ